MSSQARLHREINDYQQFVQRVAPQETLRLLEAGMALGMNAEEILEYVRRFLPQVMRDALDSCRRQRMPAVQGVGSRLAVLDAETAGRIRDLPAVLSDQEGISSVQQPPQQQRQEQYELGPPSSPRPQNNTLNPATVDLNMVPPEEDGEDSNDLTFLQNEALWLVDPFPQYDDRGNNYERLLKPGPSATAMLPPTDSGYSTFPPTSTEVNTADGTAQTGSPEQNPPVVTPMSTPARPIESGFFDNDAVIFSGLHGAWGDDEDVFEPFNEKDFD